MKYFTPELLKKMNLPPHETENGKAMEEWERAVKRYNNRLNRIKKSLPRSLQDFCNEVCLHDASVAGPITASELSHNGQLEDFNKSLFRLFQSWFALSVMARRGAAGVMLLAWRADFFVLLRYLGADDLVVEDSGLPPEFRSQQRAWLYDEIDVQWDGFGRPVYMHEILLSDGSLIRLRFRGFHLLKAV